MLNNKNDRHMHRIPKDATITSSLHKKGNVPNLIPRLKSDRLNKPKQEEFPTPVLRLTNKKNHNCLLPPETPRTRKKTPTTLKMKSVSLIDLPNEDKSQPKTWTQRKTVSREHEDDPNCKAQIENIMSNVLHPNHMFSFTSSREIELAKKVCRKLILHAWRKRISQNTSLQLVNNSLKKEVANFRIQTCVLKDLLESEKNRVRLSTNELNLVRNELEEERKNSKTLNEHLSRREVAFSEDKLLWRSLEIQMEERIGSLKNEHEIAVNNCLLHKDKALSFNQLLDDSRKNEVVLKCKIEMLETSLKDKMNDMNTLRNKSLDLQTKIEELVERNKELAREKELKEKQISGYINNLKNVEVELNNFRNFQKVHSSEFAKLRYDCEEVKTQINNKDLEIRCLQETIRLNEIEEKQIKKKCKTVALQVFQLSLNIIPLPNYIPI